MKIRIFILMMSVIAILNFGCVKDDIYVDKSVDSDIAIVINEVASNNGDPSPDWVELYNPSDAAVDITGFSLTDKPSLPSGVVFPAGTVVPAKGYYVYVCGTLGATFSISSTNGETVYLYDASGAIVDEVATPKMALGVTWSRIPDGGDVFENANPTSGVANSNTNEPPVINASLIANINDNTDYEYIISASDANGIRDVKLYLENGSDVKIVEMAPLADGKYKYKISAMLGGSTLKYYVVASDETGKKSYFPTTAPTTNASVVIANGLAQFISLGIDNENPSDLQPVNFAVNVYDKNGIASVKLYYVINSGTTPTEVSLVLNPTTNLWNGNIPGQAELSKIRYYLKATDNAALASYYPYEDANTTFKHDQPLTWPVINVAPLPNYAALVLNEVCGSQVPDDDWIEIYNSSDAEIDMSGVKLIKDGATTIYTAPTGTKIAAKAYFVVATISVNGAAVLTAGISNTKVVKLELKSPKDVVLSSFEKTATFPNASGHVTGGSYSRVPNATGDWTVVATFTKGAANN